MLHGLYAQLHAHPHDAVVYFGPGLLFAQEDAAAEPVILQSEGADHLHENGEHDRGDVWLLVKGSMLPFIIIIFKRCVGEAVSLD